MIDDHDDLEHDDLDLDLNHLDVAPEDRETASRRRSAEILARIEMSPEEIAEHAARCRANRLSRIMNDASETKPLPRVPRYEPAPPVIFKRTDNARVIVDPDRDGQSGSGEGVAAPNARRAAAPTGDEAKLLDHLARRCTDLSAQLRGRPSDEQMIEVLREMGGCVLTAYRLAEKHNSAARKRLGKLKQRIKALEARLAAVPKDAKPRVKVPSGRRVVPS